MRPVIFIFFRKICNSHMGNSKSSSSRTWKWESEVSRIEQFFNSWNSKIVPKIAKLFFYYFITCFELRLRNSFQIIGTKFLQSATLVCFDNLQPMHFQAKVFFNLSIGWLFGPFWDLQDFFVAGWILRPRTRILVTFSTRSLI